MARLVLPGGAGGGVATSFIYNRRQAGAFWRLIGGCSGLDRRGTRPEVLDAIDTRSEIVVGHENTVEPGTFCWKEHGWAFRGAVRFPLTSRELAGFDERERAWLTWRKVEDDRTGPFHACSQALTMLGQARFDWVSGAYANGTAAQRQNLEMTGIAAQISDADAVVPRSAARGLRRVEVTSIVRDWVARGHPDFGFILIGDERFRRPPELCGGAGTVFGLRWQACVGIYSGFELVFCPRDHTPSYGRSAEDT